MINNDDKIIYVNKGDTLSGYEKLNPVPEKYIDELRLLFEKINLLQGSPILGMKPALYFVEYTMFYHPLNYVKIKIQL